MPFSELTVKNNPSLKEINIGANQDVILEDLYIVGNPLLETLTITIKAGSLFQILNGNLTISENHKLPKIELPTSLLFFQVCSTCVFFYLG